MESGYLWSISYSRCRRDGKCETLRMELQLAVYSKTRHILIYFSEVNKSAIDKVIVKVSFFKHYTIGIDQEYFIELLNY